MADKIFKYKNSLLWLSIIISLLTYLGWEPIKYYYGFQVFYIGMALFIFMLSLYIWKLSSKRSIPEFVLFALSLNNLMDELFYDPTKFEMNEVVFVFILIIYSVRIKKGK